MTKLFIINLFQSKILAYYYVSIILSYVMTVCESFYILIISLYQMDEHSSHEWFIACPKKAV